MQLLELQAQGVKGCSPAIRVALKPGYLVLKPPGAAPPFGALVASLFYSDGRGGDAAFAEGGKGKVGFTLIGNDQTTYRLVRELGGAGALHKLNRASSTFELVSDSAADIGTYLRATVGFPPKSAFEQIFTCTAAQMPSRRPKSKAAAAAPALGAAPVRPSMAHTIPVEPASDIPAAQAKVAELEKELELSREVDQLQFKADGVSRQIDELDAKLKGRQGLREALQQAEADWKAAPDTLSLGLSADIVHQAGRYPAYVQKRDEALAKLGTGEEEEQPPPPPGSVEPLVRNQQFWAGVGAGALFLVLGLMMSGFARTLVLLDIPAFGFAALVALRHVEALQGASRVSKKGSFRATREKKIRDTFDAEVAPIKEAMQKLGVESPEQVARVLEQKPLLQKKVDELQEQLAAWESEPENQQAAAQHEKLKAQAETINAELTEKGAYIRDIREVERELSRTKESIRMAQTGATAAAPAPAGQPAAAGAGSGGELEDPGPALMRLGSDLFQADVPSVAGLVRDRAAQYLSALTDRRCTAVELDLNGALTVVVQGKKVKAPAVPAKDLDVVYLALRLTLIEKYAAKSKVPVVLEDTLGVEDAKLSLLSRMLKHLGTLTQVLHVTGNPAFQGVADLNASL